MLLLLAAAAAAATAAVGWMQSSPCIVCMHVYIAMYVSSGRDFRHAVSSEIACWALLWMQSPPFLVCIHVYIYSSVWAPSSFAGYRLIERVCARSFLYVDSVVHVLIVGRLG